MNTLIKFLRLANNDNLEKGRVITIEERLKAIEENYNSREEYFKYISFMESCIKYVRLRESKIISNARNRQTLVDDIMCRVMTGLGNDVILRKQGSS